MTREESIRKARAFCDAFGYSDYWSEEREACEAIAHLLLDVDREAHARGRREGIEWLRQQSAVQAVRAEELAREYGEQSRSYVAADSKREAFAWAADSIQSLKGES